MSTTRRRSKKVFIENEGFRDEQPLTKLARGLMPKVRLIKVEEMETKYYNDPEGKKLFRVVVNFGGGDKELQGYAKDEIDVYRMVAGQLEGKGYKMNTGE